jgi:hypothetical protein
VTARNELKISRAMYLSSKVGNKKTILQVIKEWISHKIQVWSVTRSSYTAVRVYPVCICLHTLEL